MDDIFEKPMVNDPSFSAVPGNSGKFRVFVDFPQKTLVRVIPGNSFWGPHSGDLGGFSGGNENGQS